MSENLNSIKMGSGATYEYIMTPGILEESYSGVREVSLSSKHFKNRVLFLTGEITDSVMNNFVSEMMYLMQTEEPIHIILNSPGGSVYAGLAIMQIIKSCEGRIPVTITCTSLAASMGAVILSGGQKSRRRLLKYGKCMIHEPLIEGGMGGSATSVERTAASLLETKALLNKILAENTGKTIEEIDEATKYDHFMNGEEAKEFGIIDEVVENIFI